MANQEHLNKLQEGVAVWNQWRLNYPDLHPNLEGVHFPYADLRYANFSNAFLRYADFSEANLQEADFRTADLLFANFSQANLSKSYLSSTQLIQADLHLADLHLTDLSNAILTDSNLSRANLSEANLTNAYLGGANLTYANLSYANLTRATTGYTIFANSNLSNAEGLETIFHEGPSSIGIDTIYLSHSKIPETFLVGAGVPKSFIINIRNLVDSLNLFDYYSCFISYSSKDEPFAKRLYADLQSNNVRCWFAPEDLKIGDHYHQRIDDSIRIYDKLILIFSEHAVQSAWVEREVVAAREKEDHKQQQVLFPIRLDDAVMTTPKAWAADVRRRWHIGDLTRWKDHDEYQVAFTRLLRDLKAQSAITITNTYIPS